VLAAHGAGAGVSVRHGDAEGPLAQARAHQHRLAEPSAVLGTDETPDGWRLELGRDGETLLPDAASFPDRQSYFLSVCVRTFQSSGCLTHASGGKNTGSTKIVHPMSPAIPSPLNRILSRIAASRDSISDRDETPFACSKTSQASQIGRAEYQAKWANPQMA
jgi:hypothetical protein